MFILGFLCWGLEEGVYMVDSLVWLYYTILTFYVCGVKTYFSVQLRIKLNNKNNERVCFAGLRWIRIT